MNTLRCHLLIAGILLGASAFAAEDSPKVLKEFLEQSRAGNKQFVAGDYAGAEKTYRTLLGAVPENVYVLSNLGAILIREGKIKQAEEVLRQAIALAPTDVYCLSTLGFDLFSLGKYDEAIVALKKTLALDPKHAKAYNCLGMTLSVKGQTQEAEKAFETSVTLDPTYTDAHYNLALLLATEIPGAAGKARQYYQRALELGAERDAPFEKLIKFDPANVPIIAVSKPRADSLPEPESTLAQAGRAQ